MSCSRCGSIPPHLLLPRPPHTVPACSLRSHISRFCSLRRVPLDRTSRWWHAGCNLGRSGSILCRALRRAASPTYPQMPRPCPCCSKSGRKQPRKCDGLVRSRRTRPSVLLRHRLLLFSPRCRTRVWTLSKPRTKTPRLPQVMMKFTAVNQAIS